MNSYIGVNNRRITRKQDEENTPKSSQSAENTTQQPQKNKSAEPFQNPQTQTGSYFPNGEKVAIDYTKKQIHIDQVLIDFRNTANAIGTPAEIKSEVETYLELIQKQAQKENPNSQIIQSNLKNASQILDEYITNTLKKPSKVVENWVDALFLQQIEYKSTAPVEEQSAQEQASEQVIDVDDAIVEEVPVEETFNVEQPVTSATVSQGYIPADEQLRDVFVQAKQYAIDGEKEKALYTFQNLLEYAQDIGDVQACAIIHYEEGRLYDDFNQLEDALYNYHMAAAQTTDDNVKARAHIGMARIYDDYVKFTPAVKHYAAAVAFSGETDNLKLQTQALSDLAQIHAQRYDKQNSFMFMDLSSIIADETQDEKVRGIIFSKNARNCQRLDEKSKALSFYGRSANAFSNIEDSESLAKSYRSAAEIMLSFGNKAKAKTLLSKAFVASQKTDNDELKMEITQLLAEI